MARRLTPELLDDPGLAPEAVARTLRSLRAVNRWLGGVSALTGCLEKWSGRWPRGGDVTMLDIATGSADLPLAALAWAERRGLRLRITAVDANPAVLRVARARVGGRAGITLREMDARRVERAFGARAFDYVHAGMFLHHLDDAGVVSLLRSMDGLARAGVIWNDMVRSRRGYAVAWLCSLGQPGHVRHDALASMRAGFREAEVRELASRAGLTYTRYSGSIFTQRFLMAGERPGAWAESPAPDTSPHLKEPAREGREPMIGAAP